MKIFELSCDLGFALLFLTTAIAQGRQPDSHLPAATPQQSQQSASYTTARKDSTNVEELRYEADELAALTRSIPADVSAANAGMLSKDIVEKLKRIEKLSKQLRKELAR